MIKLVLTPKLSQYSSEGNSSSEVDNDYKAGSYAEAGQTTRQLLNRSAYGLQESSEEISSSEDDNDKAGSDAKAGPTTRQLLNGSASKLQ